MTLKSVDSTLVGAVVEMLQQLDLSPEDVAAARLARRYAAAIDDADDERDALDRLGPKLLAALESLGATPRARAAIRKGGGATGGGGRLARLRATRA